MYITSYNNRLHSYDLTTGKVSSYLISNSYYGLALYGDYFLFTWDLHVTIAELVDGTLDAKADMENFGSGLVTWSAVSQPHIDSSK